MAQTDQPGMYGAFTIDAAGAWTYTLDNALDAVQGLSAGSTADDVFTVTAFVNSAATQDITITITGANDAPTVTVDISSPTGTAFSVALGDELNPGTVLTLTATVVDPDVNDVLTYAWRAVRGPSDEGSFSDATAAITTWTVPNFPDVFTLSLTVGDGTSNTLWIRNVGVFNDSLVFTAPIPDQLYPQGVTIPDLTLPAATGNGVGGSTTPTTYALDPVPAGLTFDDAADARVLSGTPTDPPASATTHTYTATDGQTSVSITFTINDFMPEFAATITPQTYPIGTAVSITLPEATGGNGALTYAITETLPDGLTFTATTRVLDGTPTTEQAATPYTYTATDSDGTSPDTAQLPFTITITDGSPNIVLAGGLRMTADEGEVVTLNAADSSDIDGQAITMFEWEHTATDDGQPNPEITDTDAVPATFTFTAPEERTTLTFTLTITDGNNRTADATITVEVGRSSSERALEKTLAAFGRAFAADAVDMISGHLAGNGTATANRFTLGGREIVRNDAEGHSAGYAPAVIPANAGQFCREQNCAQPEGRVSGTIRAIQRGHTDQPDRWGDTWQDDNPSINYLSTRALLAKSAFHYNLSDSTGSGSGAPSIWGRATHGNYEGKPDNFTLDGNLSSAYLGMDFRAGERRQAGVAVSYTEGRVNYTDALDDSTGNLDAELTSVLPYMRYTTDGGLGVWGLLGYGTGDARLRSDDGDPTTTDIEMLLAAAGVRGTWLSPQHQELAWKASVFAVEMESEAVASQDLPSVDAESQRLRLAIAGRARHEVPGSGGAESAYLAPTWELGLRWDDGDAESGAGADLGLGLQYDNPASGWQVQARGRYLLVHEEGDYEEWSASMEARKNLGNRNRGLALTLTPDWNQRQSSQRVGLDFSGLINNKWKTDGLRLEVYGERHQQRNDAPGHQIGLSGELRF